HEGTKITKKTLRELHLPQDVNFGGYIRDGKGYVCSGGTQIEAGDHVVVFCLAESVHKIEKLFE
ncbi:MAG: Trk system potassium transporter TrkA, partial [Prevotellaceae bacterium]|nr:Trk system potassium transporter TrkA [Prevotellaceae bacterium]